MLRNKGLTEKLIVLGIDGMDPRFTRAMVDEGKMPNTKKLIEMKLYTKQKQSTQTSTRNYWLLMRKGEEG